MEGPLMYDEVEQIYNDEVLNTRRELQESSVNLEQLAKYCEQSFRTHQDQQLVFDQSKGYVVQSLVNVSHRLTKLSTNLFQLLSTHNQRLDNIGHQLFCIEQNFENVQNYQSKDRIKCLGSTISIQRQHKVVQNKTISKDSKKHLRKPINLAALDNIGHGVVVQEEPRPIPLQHNTNLGFMSSRSETLMSRNEVVTTLPASRSHQPFNTSAVHQNGVLPRPDHMAPHNGYAGVPVPHPMTLERGMANMALDHRNNNFDRAMTIDRSMMLERDPRHQMYDNVGDRQYMPGAERLSGGGSDRGSDQLSPNVNNTTRFNNWMNSDEAVARAGDGRMRPVYERSYAHGVQPPQATHDVRQDIRHPPAPYDRSMSSSNSDDFRVQPVQNTPYPRRESSQTTPPPPPTQYAQTPYSQQHAPYPPQPSYPPGHAPAHQITNIQYHATKGYGSRGSLDDSSCSSSSPSLHSYKTNNSSQRNFAQHKDDYDEKSSQPSTNGPLSDSGLGTWAQSDPHIQSEIPSQPPSDLELFDPEYAAGGDYIPSNFIKKVQAIFRYNKTSDDELTLPVGATIYVLQEHSDGWSEGFYNGQCGYFPANFTTIIDR